ncbi:hypothetical protein FOHLNKBM_5550 [Methylobacterium longum]|nr:hypothetical protein FOHLNKBM_5550 [Methylobacterium longum]
MIRSAIALALVATSAIAAPTAHRQPTPAALPQTRGNPTNPGSTDAKAPVAQMNPDRNKMQREFDERQKAMDAKTKRTMGGICSGC